MRTQAESWELSKENYVPVKSGRKKAALSELTDPADSANKQALEQRRRCGEKKRAVVFAHLATFRRWCGAD